MSRTLTVLKTIANWIYGLRSTAGSINGYLNPVELLRVVVPALLHGGGVYEVLTAILGSASTIFVAQYAGVAVAVITALVQIVRLFNHGDDPAPTPSK
jgi:hypothetical protein